VRLRLGVVLMVRPAAASKEGFFVRLFGLGVFLVGLRLSAMIIA